MQTRQTVGQGKQHRQKPWLMMNVFLFRFHVIAVIHDTQTVGPTIRNGHVLGRGLPVDEGFDYQGVRIRSKVLDFILAYANFGSP